MLLYNEVDLNVTFPKALLGNCFIDRSFVCLCAALSVTHTFKVIDRSLFSKYTCALLPPLSPKIMTTHLILTPKLPATP